ncbi:MAG: TOBE domain-containing protein [Candidatus Helarchaeota archaeon]
MKISARNKIKSVIEKIENQGLISKIDLRTLEPSKITIIITKKSAEEMKLKPGDSINVIIKPTEIIIKNIIE